MKKKNGYGQNCPLAISAEILCNRWTMLVVRELLEGSTGFNEIRRGVTLMSRTMLSNRLKELESAGLLIRATRSSGKSSNYRLTASGEALGPIVFGIAEWGQRWIEVEPSVEHVDTDFLMWDIRRNVQFLPDFPARFVVLFLFHDAPVKKTHHWLVFANNEVELCYVDPGYDVDVEIHAAMRTMVKVWMGWTGFDAALSAGELTILGPRKFTRLARKWLGLSSFSHIEKQPKEQRVLRTMRI